MFPLFTKLISEQSFGQRVFAVLTSIYAIATFFDLQTLERPGLPGYENIARALEWFGLNPVAAWIRDPLFSSLQSSEVAEAAIWILLLSSYFGMVATFRRSIYNVAPPATFGCLLALVLLNDLGRLNAWTSVALLFVGALLAALFVRFVDSEALEPWFGVAPLVLMSPVLAGIYAPVRILAWFLQEPGHDTQTMQVESGYSPVRVKIVD